MSEPWWKSAVLYPTGDFAREPAEVSLAGRWMVEVDSDGASEGMAFPGRLGGDQTVILRPAE